MRIYEIECDWCEKRANLIMIKSDNITLNLTTSNVENWHARPGREVYRYDPPSGWRSEGDKDFCSKYCHGLYLTEDKPE